MKSMTVGKLKGEFSEVLKQVQAGEPVAVELGRKHTRVAVIVPYAQYRQGESRVLGVLEGEATYRVRADWDIPDEEMVTP